MILYLDTSALAKLYLDEEGNNNTPRLSDVISRYQALTCSVVAYAEARAAFARLVRERILTIEQQQTLLRKLNSDWEQYLLIETTHAVIKIAGDLPDRYALRGFDAIHLASAIWLAERVNFPVHFAAYDKRLLDAATQMGMVTIPNSL